MYVFISGLIIYWGKIRNLGLYLENIDWIQIFVDAWGPQFVYLFQIISTMLSLFQIISTMLCLFFGKRDTLGSWNFGILGGLGRDFYPTHANLLS
jgi:hypothetical protein